jgi:hypothetical protein
LVLSPRFIHTLIQSCIFLDSAARFVFQAQLQWPTGLSLSPLDGSLHFIDDRLVLKLTDDLKVKVVAGTPLHCHMTTGSSNSDHSQHSKQHSGGNNSENSSGGDSSAVKVQAASILSQ